jgi:hypothetical protein
VTLTFVFSCLSLRTFLRYNVYVVCFKFVLAHFNPTVFFAQAVLKSVEIYENGEDIASRCPLPVPIKKLLMVCIAVCEHVCASVYVCVYAYVRMSMCVYVCVCL